jgi:hypothetical protein
MYATPQLLDQFVWVPVRDTFISSCGHTGLTVLDAVLREMVWGLRFYMKYGYMV